MIPIKDINGNSYQGTAYIHDELCYVLQYKRSTGVVMYTTLSEQDIIESNAARMLYDKQEDRFPIKVRVTDPKNVVIDVDNLISKGETHPLLLQFSSLKIVEKSGSAVIKLTTDLVDSKDARHLNLILKSFNNLKGLGFSLHSGRVIINLTPKEELFAFPLKVVTRETKRSTVQVGIQAEVSLEAANRFIQDNTKRTENLKSSEVVKFSKSRIHTYLCTTTNRISIRMNTEEDSGGKKETLNDFLFNNFGRNHRSILTSFPVDTDS